MRKEKPKSKPKGKPSSLSTRGLTLIIGLGIATIIPMFYAIISVWELDTPQHQAEIDVVRFDEGVNLLANASFEQDPRLFDWVIDERNTDLETSWTSDEVLSGNHAIELTSSRGSNQGWAGRFMTMPITDGYDYTLSAMTFSKDGASGWLSIDLLDQNGRLLMGYSTGCSESVKSWVEKSISIDAEDTREEGAVMMRLGLQQCLNFSEGTETTLYIDDVSLIAE